MSDPLEEENFWPQKGKELFSSGPDGWDNACLHWGSDNSEAIRSGFLQGADMQVEYVLQHRRNQDLLVFPILFQYRHYIELRLKQIIEMGRDLIGQSDKDPWGHKLLELWKIARPLLEKVEPNPSGDTLDAVEETIEQLAQVDPEGDSFRYSKNKKGKNPLGDLTHINLRNLRDVIKGITAFLEGASMQLSVYIEHKMEIDKEYRQAADEMTAEYESEMRGEMEEDMQM